MRNRSRRLAKLLAGSRSEEVAQAKATMDALEVTWLQQRGQLRPLCDARHHQRGVDSATRRRQGRVRCGASTVRGGAAGLYPGGERPEGGGHRRRARHLPGGGRRRWRWRSGSSPTPGSMRRRTAWSRTASWSRATWPRPPRRCTRSRCQARSGSAPMCRKSELGKIRLGMAADHQHRQLSGSRLSRLDRLPLAHRRVHAEDGGNAGAAHRPGLSAPGLCLRPRRTSCGSACRPRWRST